MIALFDIHQWDGFKSSTIFQHALSVVKQWITKASSPWVNILIDTNVYNPLDILEHWGHSINRLEKYIVPSVHSEQPKPLYWLKLNIDETIHEHILENLLLINLIEIKRWRSGDTRYACSVCLWSVNPHTYHKVYTNCYKRLGKIRAMKQPSDIFRPHYIRYWDVRVYPLLKTVFDSKQRYCYQYLLEPCGYIDHRLKFVGKDSLSKPISQSTINSKNIKEQVGTVKVGYLQWQQLQNIHLINQGIVLAYEYKEDLYDSSILKKANLAEIINGYISTALSHQIYDKQNQYCWILLSLTIHPNFYQHPQFKMTLVDGDNFLNHTQTIDDATWMQVKNDLMS